MTPGKLEEDEIGLAQAVTCLRRELRQAVEAAQDEGLRFTVDKVVLDFEVEVTKERGGGGGIRFWVVSAEGRTSRTSASTNRITVELRPTADGAPVEIRDQGGSTPPDVGP